VRCGAEVQRLTPRARIIIARASGGATGREGRAGEARSARRAVSFEQDESDRSGLETTGAKLYRVAMIMLQITSTMVTLQVNQAFKIKC
jgi:hypothetical protein